MVVTIFDMIPEEEMAPWHRNPHFFKLTYMQKADLILTSSESTARKIENLGLEATVIPLASPLSAPPKDAQSKVNRTGLLYVGRRTGYKNFAGLLRVLALTEPTIHLTVFGGGPSTHAERALVASLGLGERVIWSELSSSDHLRSLYLSSAVHVIPSKREGFGLTQLEAMQHGCVNFLNEIPVFREVSGESAVYSDFDDPHESAYKLQSLYFDTNRLQKIRESGLVHEQNFTWERVAAETLSAYRRVINS
ncbi:glycosyltransferase [Aquiluna sp.]|nr:glycosyltransferase [Aquiluna sp.]